MEPRIGVFYDALTGETVERELTAQEIAEIESLSDETTTIVDDDPIGF